MREEVQPAQIIRFKSFEVNLRCGELWKDGQKVKLAEQSFQILAMLLERPGEVVLRGEIQKRLWPNDTVVEFENSINAAIRKLRVALGDSADSPQYIETLARRGYRWMVPVEWTEANSAGLPAVEPAALSPQPAAAAASLIGKRVSHYRVLEVLGGGGMGVVYKAEDVKLGRRVALKFLPEELAGDPAALERFEREARAASALEHPNICPVYEFAEHEGQPFIAMQLLEGQTLRDRLADAVAAVYDRRAIGLTLDGAHRAPLQIDEMLNLAIQIANGLDAAHGKGIIHRDIKPANIFVTTRGEAKILDFGLAKLQGLGFGGQGLEAEPTTPLTPDPKSLTPDLTRTGVKMGTAPYMSPEQVRGEKLDARTDLFSFGLVLYEMATGHVAFAGETVVQVYDAIVNRRLSPARALNPDIPSQLEEIISRALEKDREARYQTASEMRNDVEHLKTELASSKAAVDLRQARSRRKTWRLVAFAGAAALIFILSATWLILNGRRAQSTGPFRIEPFTGLSGFEDQPALSPDGKQLAYVWDDGSVRTLVQTAPLVLGHIYVKLIGAGAPLQLTHDARFDQSPAWSPDGRYIAFIRSSDAAHPGRCQVISVPALGGPERRLADTNWSFQPEGRGLTWSPDGKFIAINTASADESGLYLISAENGEKRRLTLPPQDADDSDPAFSPDGHTVAFVRHTALWRGEVYLQSVNGTEARRLTFDNTMIWGLAWTPDGRDIVFSSQRSGFTTLWKIPAAGGEIEPVAGVGGNARYPAVSAHGNLLAYVNSEMNTNIWGIRLTASGRAEGPPQKVISGTGQQIESEISPDGKRIVFASDRSGNLEIWVANIDGSNPLQLTSLHAPLTGSPRWSADGRWIAFGSEIGEHAGAFVVSAEGGTPRRLTPPSVRDLVPSWSRDGKWIYFCKDFGGIWKMPAQGGEAVEITKNGLETRESEDGTWLYFSRPLGTPDNKTAILKMPVEGGPETLVFNEVTNRFWALAGQYLYFMELDAKLHATIKRFNLKTREITRIADVEREPYLIIGWTGFSASPDGTEIIYPQIDEDISRIMLVENFRW